MCFGWAIKITKYEILVTMRSKTQLNYLHILDYYFHITANPTLTLNNNVKDAHQLE